MLIGIGFTLAIMMSGTMLAKAIGVMQKNTRGIEDVNISYFAAEALAEKALLVISSNHKGYEDAENINLGTINANNFLKSLSASSSIDARIDNSDCPSGLSFDTANTQCSGYIPYGKSSAVWFSYDDSTGFNHSNDGDGTNILFDYDTNEFNLGNNWDNDNNSNTPMVSDGNIAIMNWIASYTIGGGESILYALHDADDSVSTYGDKADDCWTSANKGKLICRKTLSNEASLPFTFPINNTVSGFLDDPKPKNADSVGITNDITDDFFKTANAQYKKIRFVYINIINGTNAGDAALDKIRFRIEPAAGQTMLATKTLITAKGVSRGVQSSIQITIDNTQEFTALEYSALLE